jgi:hypothetical protein
MPNTVLTTARRVIRFAKISNVAPRLWQLGKYSIQGYVAARERDASTSDDIFSFSTSLGIWSSEHLLCELVLFFYEVLNSCFVECRWKN